MEKQWSTSRARSHYRGIWTFHDPMPGRPGECSPIVSSMPKRGRFALLTPEHRTAIAAFCWRTENGALERWVRASPPGPDWFDRFLA